MMYDDSVCSAAHQAREAGKSFDHIALELFGKGHTLEQINLAILRAFDLQDVAATKSALLRAVRSRDALDLARAMRDRGASLEECLSALKAAGFEYFDCLKGLNEGFGLSAADSKETMRRQVLTRDDEADLEAAIGEAVSSLESTNSG